MPRYTEEFEGLVQGNDHRPLLSFLVESQVITLTCCDWNNKIALLPCVHTKRCICCPNTLPPRFCGAANQVLRRGKGFAARQRFCGAAKVLRRGKGFAARQRFWCAGSFAARQVLPAVLLNSFKTMADITSIACLYLLWKR